MMGNCHVRFLGEGDGATHAPLPDQHDNRSVEYKTTGWKLDPDGKHIKRVRIVKRADGYYCQLAVQARRRIEHTLTERAVGIDVGLKSYYTDSDGMSVANPRYFRKAEHRLKRVHRRLSRTHKGQKEARQSVSESPQAARRFCQKAGKRACVI
jgi:putative transposase